MNDKAQKRRLDSWDEAVLDAMERGDEKRLRELLQQATDAALVGKVMA